MNLVAKAEISQLKWTQVSVQGWCGILVDESHVKVSSEVHPSFWIVCTSCLMKRGLSSSPLGRFSRRSHCILSLSGRHGFHGSTSLRPEWGPSFPGQRLPHPSPAPGRHGSPPSAHEVQWGAAPGGWCPRQQRRALCGRGGSSAGASRGAQRWSGSPGAGHPLPSPGENRSFFCPTDRSEGRVCSFGPGAWGSACQPARGSETDHRPEILPGHSWPAPRLSVERARNPWGRWGCCRAGWDCIWWNLGGRVSDGNLSKQGLVGKMVLIVWKFLSHFPCVFSFRYFLFDLENVVNLNS